MVHLTRRYRFSASHRLNSRSLSTEENVRVFGKCNNPYGHGHNYTVHVTVAGEIEPSTGMVLDLAVLDRVVGEEVLEPFGYAHLNLDVARFAEIVPTSENVCQEIYRRVRDRLRREPNATQVKLERVLLEETQSNYFECDG